jgi:hypothetical protein
VADTKVTIAYIHGAEVTYSWFQSMMALVSYDVANNAHIIGGGWLATKYGTGGIIQARNDTARQFVHHTDSEWLFWIDTDMGFSPTPSTGFSRSLTLRLRRWSVRCVL